MKKIFTLLLLSSIVNVHAQTPGSTGSAEDPQVSIEDDKDAYVPNEFIGSFTMEIHSFKKGTEEKDSPMSMRLWSKEDMVMMQPMVDQKGAEMKMLTDLKNKYQYTLMKDEKGRKTAIKQPKKKITVKNAGKNDDEEMKVERTGGTKTIDGHLCHEYIGSNEDGKWTAWVAEDLKAPFQDLAQSFAGGMAKNKGSKAPRNHTEGLPLESTWESSDGKEKVVMYIRDLKLGSVDESAFDINGYEVMEMPSMPGMGGMGQ